MERYELKSYDPFPLKVGDSHTIGDFTFSFERSSKKTTHRYHYGGNRTVWSCHFCIEDNKTGDKRKSKLDLGWNVDAKKQDLNLMKAILLVRKRYSRRLTLFAFQKSKPASAYRWGRTDARIKTGTTASSELTGSYIPSGMGWLDTTDDFMVRLKIVLDKDNKEWTQRRREERKSGNLVKGQLNDVEDTIRTKELMALRPMLADAESAIATLLSKGNNYTKKQADDVGNALYKINNGQGLMVMLKKWGK